MSEGISAAELRRAIEILRTLRSDPNVLIIHPQRMERLEYIAATKTLWELPGARRLRGPDGDTWIEKKWRTADVHEGSGNKARRRMGLPVNSDDGWN